MCISSIQQSNEDSIEFFLSTWTWSVIKSSQTKSLHLQRVYSYLKGDGSQKRWW